MVILFCVESWVGLLGSQGNRSSEVRFFCSAPVAGSSPEITRPSSGGVVLIGGENPFSVLTSGEGALAGGPALFKFSR